MEVSKSLGCRYTKDLAANLRGKNQKRKIFPFLTIHLKKALKDFSPLLQNSC